MNRNNPLTGSFSSIFNRLMGRLSAGETWQGAGFRRLVLLVVTTAFLAGCSLVKDSRTSGGCPNLALVKDAVELTRFAGDGRDLTDIAFVAKIDNYKLDCAFAGDDDVGTRRAENRIALRFEAEQGAVNPENQASFSYFVAVVGQNGEILKREAFDLSIPLNSNAVASALVDNVFITIPLAPGEGGEDYTICVGFELTRGEILYNRSRF